MELLELFKKSEAVLEGHFLLSSGKHSQKYVQCEKLMQYPDRAQKVVSAVAEKVKELGIDVIVGPAMGGIRAAYELGRQLNIRTIFTERVDNVMTLRRGFEIKDGEKVLIMEDVVTTGKSSLETAAVIESFGGNVIGIGCLVDRKISTIDLPIYSAIELYFEAYEQENCPECKNGTEAIKPGSRKM
ncbi:MAG TPA: orotate phosphoribosyltransferase [Clostridiales bacterium]|nr:orotate phosphoribosyltransferase [Clostridiales bacterium]